MDATLAKFMLENQEELLETQNLFKAILGDILQKEGSEAMLKTAYAYIEDAHTRVEMAKNTTCSAGCSFCCYSDIVITTLEAEAIKKTVSFLNIPFKKDRLKRQNSKAFHRLKYADKACLMLAEDGKCNIYDHRPMICRLWNSTSHPSKCDDSAGRVMTNTGRVVKCWAMMLALVDLDQEINKQGIEVYLHKILN